MGAPGSTERTKRVQLGTQIAHAQFQLQLDQLSTIRGGHDQSDTGQGQGDTERQAMHPAQFASFK